MHAWTDPETIEWFRYPLTAAHAHARRWMASETLLGLAANTLDAYARGIEDFLRFCDQEHVDLLAATRETIARYIGDLRRRPRPSGSHGSASLTVPTGHRMRRSNSA